MADDLGYQNFVTMLGQIQSALILSLQGGKVPVDWKVGEVDFKNGTAFKDLMAMQADIIKIMQNSFPTEVITTHQDLVLTFGQDLTDYANEQTPGLVP